MPHGVPGSHVPPINFDDLNEFEREAYEVRAEQWRKTQVDKYISPNMDYPTVLTNNGTNNFIILPVIAFILWRFFK